MKSEEQATEDLIERIKEKKGNKNLKVTCIDCGKKLKDYRSKRCRCCWKKNETFFLDKQIGGKNVNWKGDKVGYRGLHYWVIRNKPKTPCIKCGSNKNLQVSNISGEYKREINDYEWLCAKCHICKDGTINNLNTKNRRKS